MPSGNAPKDYDARLCISYLDEAEPYQVADKLYKSIVSLTALKKYYINGLENDWKQLRIKYNVPQGVYLHFSDIKQLLNLNSTKHNSQIKTIFSKLDDSIDYKKIYDFFTDIQSIIHKNNFVIQATGIEFPRKPTKYGGLKLNSVMYQLFYEHLDRMAFYLMDLGLIDYEKRKKMASTPSVANNVNFEFYFSKLRYDGGYGLSERNEYRNAYSHCISDGTKHFSSRITKDVFDTLSFISKDEVGKCTNCVSSCSYEFVSHAGDELVDYITVYVSRDMWKDRYKDYMVNMEHKNSLDIDVEIDQMTTIRIPGYPPIYPIKDIKPKLFINQDITLYKLIIDHPY